MKSPFRGRVTIRRRILVGFGSVIALLFVAGAYGTTVLRTAHRVLQRRMSQVGEVKSQLFASEEATRQYVMLAQSDLLRGGDRYAERMDSVSDLADSLRMLMSVEGRMTDEERNRLAQIAALQGRIGTRLAMARAYTDLGDRDAATLQINATDALLDSLFAASASVLRAEDARSGTMLGDAERAVGRQQLLVRTLLALGLLAALAVGYATLRAVTSPLNTLAAAARRVGEGDLRHVIDPTGLDEEYRVVAQALADTTARLSNLVREIQRESHDLADASQALTTVSGAAAESTNRVSESMLHIADAALDQRTAVAGTHAVLARVQQTSDVLDATARDAAELESEVRRLTDGARQGIDDAMVTLTRTRDVIGASAQNVERVEQSSAIVHDLLQTIQKISEQTDLLALNAAIEAARAGKTGHGFAVVAEEVRKLADLSNHTADEVFTVVAAMRREVSTAVTAFREGVGSLGNVDTTSRTVTGALHTIELAIARMDELTRTVRHTAQANRNAVQELTTHMGATSSHAEAQAETSEQARGAAEETAAASEEVAATASQVSDSAVRLQTLVSTFSV